MVLERTAGRRMDVATRRDGDTEFLSTSLAS
jgi:hypothetical protein